MTAIQTVVFATLNRTRQVTISPDEKSYRKKRNFKKAVAFNNFWLTTAFDVVSQYITTVT